MQVRQMRWNACGASDPDRAAVGAWIVGGGKLAGPIIQLDASHHVGKAGLSQKALGAGQARNLRAWMHYILTVWRPVLRGAFRDLFRDRDAPEAL
jgi:hypothetical protein